MKQNAFRAAWVCAPAFLAWTQVLAAASVLAPGPDILDCRSALRSGPVECNGPPRADAAQSAGDSLPAAPNPPRDLEQQVDRFLEGYGKPPREAVRALLDPTDENIRALLQKQGQTLATASYVAARMTRLQQEESPRAADPRWPDPDLPLFARLRLTLYQRPDDAGTQPALLALQGLGRTAPSLQVRVGLVGAVDSADLREFLRRMPPALDVVRVPGDEGLAQDLPQLQIDDLRNAQTFRIDAHGLDAAQLHAWIGAVRHLAPGERRVADSAAGSTP